VHIRDAKGHKDHLVPLPTATQGVLRRFWQLHRHPALLFPNRHGGLKAAARARTPLDRGGVQLTLRKVADQFGLTHLHAAPPIFAGFAPSRQAKPLKVQYGSGGFGNVEP
jgi:integrase